MRQPEADEHHVVTTVRHPGEQIGLNKAHPFVIYPLVTARHIQALVQVIRGEIPVVGNLLIEEPLESFTVS